MADQPLTDCPACGKAGLRKLLSAPNFRLKGGGWYETDFKSKNKRNLVDGDKSAKGAGDSDGAGKSSVDKATDKSADTGKSASAGGNTSKAE
jgi:predicted nucleic acid-binding Zn ribbon protein